MSQAEFIKISAAIACISYPTTKGQLIEHARGNDVKAEILYVLQKLPDHEDYAKLGLLPFIPPIFPKS